MPTTDYCETRCTRVTCDYCDRMAPEPDEDDATMDASTWDEADEAAHRADLAYHDANC